MKGSGQWPVVSGSCARDVMFWIRLRNPLARIIYNPKEDSSKPDAIFPLAGSVCWRRNSRSYFHHWRGRQVCTDHATGVQLDFMGDYSHEVELAAPCPATERTIPARLSQGAAIAGYRHGRRSVPAQPASWRIRWWIPGVQTPTCIYRVASQRNRGAARHANW